MYKEKQITSNLESNKSLTACLLVLFFMLMVGSIFTLNIFAVFKCLKYFFTYLVMEHIQND